MVEWIVGSIICREFWNHEPSWRFVVYDMRAERRGEHVIQSPTNRAEGDPYWPDPPLVVVLVDEGASQLRLVQLRDQDMPPGPSLYTVSPLPPMPGIWGPSLEHIASDSWDFLSCLIFVETLVELELSSGYMWQVGGDLCSGCIPCSLWRNFAFLGYVVSLFCLELVHWLLGC